MIRKTVLLLSVFMVLAVSRARATPVSREGFPAKQPAFRKHLDLRESGDYEGARRVLEMLLESEPGNATFHAAMGVLLLRAYRTPQDAIPFLQKSLELDPHESSAYSDLGDAYQRLGQPEKATALYQDAVRLVPYAHWTDHARSELKALRFSREGSLIRDWLVLGPFPPGAFGKADEKFPIPIERKNLADWVPPDPPGPWRRPFENSAFGFVDFNEALGHSVAARAFALTQVWSPEARDVVFRVGSDDQLRIWVNTELVHEWVSTRAAEVDSDAVDVPLLKGWNQVIVEVENRWGDWGFFFRVTDRRFKVLEDVFFDPTRRDPAVRRAIWRARMPKLLAWLVFGLVALNIVFLALALALRVSRNVAITRAKAEFLSHVSHDLKTPLASMKMFAESLILDRVDEDKRKVYLRYIVDEIERLGSEIENFLDFSRVERGDKMVQAELQDITPLLSEAAQRFEAGGDGLVKVRLEISEGLPPVNVDKRLFSRALANLLDNARKYAPDGREVILHCSREDQRVTVAVRDFGPGIGAEEKVRIFDTFYRGRGAREQGVAGTGIGLSYVRHIVEQHGGTISVESPAGGGTAFVISLPL